MEVRWMEHKGRKILSIDYSGIKMEKKMIEHLHSAIPLLEEVKKGDNVYVVSDLTGCFATPGFIDAAKKLEKDVLSRYKLKWCILGIKGPKVILLKGFNLVSKIKCEPFETREEALEYLCNDK